MIDSEAVTQALRDSLYLDDELTDDQSAVRDGVPEPVMVEGILHNFAFHPARLHAHHDQVMAWVKQLPTEFHRETGGGWSFLQLCVTADGVQWTGLHLVMEQLCALAIGLRIGEWCAPRRFWNALPGGMPYIVFNTSGVKIGDASRPADLSWTLADAVAKVSAMKES